jgi:hypothetical protein
MMQIYTSFYFVPYHTRVPHVLIYSDFKLGLNFEGMYGITDTLASGDIMQGS